jgi:endonuclease YncB( thermonuclease family)
MPLAAILAAIASLSGCYAVDGDTLRCNGERIRLLGIDAPEFSCPRGRTCVAGDPRAAKAYLAALIEGRSLTIARVGKDRYDRTLAVVYADGRNVSCQMVSARHAAYVAKWDNEGRVARDCRAITRR